MGRNRFRYILSKLKKTQTKLKKYLTILYDYDMLLKYVEVDSISNNKAEYPLSPYDDRVGKRLYPLWGMPIE